MPRSREMVRLAEGIHGKLSVAVDRVSVMTVVFVLFEVPEREFLRKLRAE